MSSYLKEALMLEADARKLRERHEAYTEAESQIRIGTVIFDLDAGKYAVVEGLKKGCIDFSADYIDGSYSRGYHYVVPNWRLAPEYEAQS